MKLRSILWLLPAALFLSCTDDNNTTKPEMNYPVTEKKEHVDEYHGVAVEDPYHWLEDDMSEETGEWVTAQNEVTFGYLDEIDFKPALKERLKQLLNYERISAPTKEGDYTYYTRNDGLQNHSVMFRVPNADPDAEPEVYLDPNGWSEDATIALRGVYFTEDGKLSAHLITEGGSDWRKIIVMDTESKRVIEDTIVNVKFSGASWLGNGGFFYSSYDNPEDANASELSAKTDQHKLFYHKLGTPQSEDELVFGGAKQPYLATQGFVTEDERYLVIIAFNKTSGNELFVRDLQGPRGNLVTINNDESFRISFLENVGQRFYFLTNKGAPNYRVVSVNLDDPQSWDDVIAEDKHVLTAGTAGGKIFAEYLIDAKSAVKQYDLDGNFEHDIELPGIGSAGGFGGRFDDEEIYYTFTSFTFPSTIYKYDIAKGTSELYRSSDVDFDPDGYETKQVFYNSKDGTRVPMFIVHKKGIKMDGSNPTYLYGYGGFNSSQTPGFSAFRVAWLENGGVYAVANLRGGGEYGAEWHEAGTKMKKQNVFDDFIAAAEYLIDEKYTSPERLGIAGGSNGGLLVGATMTQRPELFAVALPAVGVMDMLRFHKFTIGAAWASDYGTSEDSPEMFEYLRKYSPYHALKPGTKYPATLVTTADHDDRVVPAHSFKFAARLQECDAGDNPQLIRIQTNAGHGSVSTDQRIALVADMYAFAWENMDYQPQFEQID